MIGSRLRSAGFVAVLALASMLAMVLAWAVSAQSAIKPKPTPEDRIANVQLLGVNDFHGNLKSPRTLPTSTPTSTSTKHKTPTAPSGCTLGIWLGARP